MHIGKATQIRKNNINSNVMLQYVRDQSSVDEEVDKNNDALLKGTMSTES
jgi:hypothetical protein